MNKYNNIFFSIWTIGFSIFVIACWYFLVEFYTQKDKSNFVLVGCLLITIISCVVIYHHTKKDYDYVENYLLIVITSLIIIYFISFFIDRYYFTDLLGIERSKIPQKNYDNNLLIGAVIALIIAFCLTTIITWLSSLFKVDTSNFWIFLVSIFAFLSIIFPALFEIDVVQESLLKEKNTKKYYKLFTEYNKKFDQKQLKAYWDILKGLIGFYIAETIIKRNEYKKEQLKEKQQ